MKTVIAPCTAISIIIECENVKCRAHLEVEPKDATEESVHKYAFRCPHCNWAIYSDIGNFWA